MSNFLKIVREALPAQPKTPEQKKKDKNLDATKLAVQAKLDGTATNDQRRLAMKAAQRVRDALQVASVKKKGKVVEAEGDEVAPAVDPALTDPAAAAPDVTGSVAPEPLTTEGEVFLVNLAKDCLNTDLATIKLDAMGIDRSLITQDVHPENAKEIIKVLERIVGEEGYGESFDSKIDGLIEDLKKNDRVVVLVPGSFKPPHKGHYEMVKQYSQMYPTGQVQVIISAPSAASQRETKDGKIITPAAALAIFKEYVKDLTNVDVFVSKVSSPVRAAYDTIETEPPGTTVVLGASKKDEDWKRWVGIDIWADKQGLELNIIDPLESAVDVTLKPDGTPYSASNIRDNFDNWEQIKADIPDDVDKEFIQNIFNSL